MTSFKSPPMNLPLNIEKYTRSQNTARNIVFIGLCLSLVGWYGLEITGRSDEVISAITNENHQPKVGGDVSVEYIASKIIVPVLSTTTTLNGAEFSAKSFLIKDHETGETLVAKEEYVARPIASITKLMSGLILLDAGLDPYTGTTTAANGEVFDTFLQSHFVYEKKDVWNTAFVGSSNRAVLSLVDQTGITRDEFVKRMNDKARELGMSDAVFFDPTGLDEKDVASASDVLMLLNAALSKKEIADALLLKQYQFATVKGEHKRDIYNTNWLLIGWIPNSFSKLYPGKTGYIPASGYNFTTRVENAEGRVIDIVILGANSHEARFEEARDLAEWVFENYTWQEKTIMVPKK